METEEQKAARLAKEATAAAVKAAVSEAVEPLKNEIKTATEKNIELQTKLAATEAKVELIEKSPVFQGPGFGRSKEYHGYKIKTLLSGAGHSGTNLREVFAKGGFVLSDEEAQEDFAKNMLDIFHALDRRVNGQFVAGRAEAKQAMKERMDRITKTNALNETTTTEGGYTVQPEYQWDIIKLARNQSWALRLASVVPMVSNQQYWPAESSLGVVTWENEGSQKTPSEPTFGQVSLTAKKAFCLARMSNELLADTSIDIVGLLTEQFAYATGQDLDNQWLNGNGSPWSGLLSTITTSVILGTTPSISGIVFGDLSNAIAQIVEARLAGAAWLMNRIPKHYIRSLKGTTGQPIYANPGAGVPGTIYEFPAYQSEKMSNSTAAAQKSILFGNFKTGSIIGRRNGLMTIDVDPYGLFDYDQTRFRMTTRWAHAQATTDSLVMIKTS